MATTSTTALIRNPFFQDRFYTANPENLAATVDDWLCDASPAVRLPAALREALPPESLLPPEGVIDAHAVMLPHAGHVYCGRVIGQTLARCRLPRRLVLLCPQHTGPGPELAVWPSGSWRTPLGTVPVDETLAATLLQSGRFQADTSAHTMEHSLEVLLPFLQRHTPDCTIVPVRVSSGVDRVQDVALVLAQVLWHARRDGNPVGMVLSSDMNHYAPEQENMRRDCLALAPLLGMDPISLFNTVHKNGISMCGVWPVTLGLLALKALDEVMPPARAFLTAYTTSGEVSQDTHGVVGYAGVVFA